MSVVSATNNHAEATMDAIGVLYTNPLDDYELIHRIGSGTYGDVFKVMQLVNTPFLCETLNNQQTVGVSALLILLTAEVSLRSICNVAVLGTATATTSLLLVKAGL